MNVLPVPSGTVDFAARDGRRAGRARRGIHASPDCSTLWAVRDVIKGRRLSAPVLRRPPAGRRQVATPIDHAADLAPVERPVGPEVEVEPHEPELVEVVEL